jgi:fructosamine-3-kinase
MLPDTVRAAVEHELAVAAGCAVSITAARAIGGGCISPNARIETSAGESCFLKWAEPGAAPAELFRQEARSLRAINAAGAVRVPRVLAHAREWLLLEWLEPGRPTAHTWATLGTQLAALHGTRGVSFGWDADNFIGTLPQPNGSSARWAPFWAENRLLPQFERAARQGRLDVSDRRAFDRLLARMDTALMAGDGDGPSLLHGDLWGGNAHVMAGGEPAVIDPSSYYGHREVDLAMAELFGGFEAGFFSAYREAWPLAAGYDEMRREIYQLYYLLVHVNLFGASYVAGTRRILRKFGG